MGLRERSFHHALPPANEGRGDDRRPRSEPEYLGIARTVPAALGGKEGAVGRRGRARRYRAVHSSPRCGVPVQYQSLFSARSLPESEKSVGRLDGGIPNPSRPRRGVRWPGRPVRPRSGPLAPGIVGIRRLGASDVLDRSVRQPIGRPRVDEETIRLPLCPRTVLARGQTKIRVLCPPYPLGGAVHRPAGPSDGPEGRQARDQFGPRGAGGSPGQGGRLDGRGDDRAPGRFSRGEGDRLLRSRPFRLEELSSLRRASGGKAIRCEGLAEPRGNAVAVDFAIKTTPKYRVVSVRFVGPFNERRIRSEWERLAKWAKTKRLNTGKWFFSEEDAGKAYRFDLSIEVRGHVKGEGKVRVRTFPASPIATVTFDPDVVAARVIYHGLSDWLRWRKKDKAIKRTRTWREVYSGNPWTDKRDWSHTEIQVLVSK